MSLFQLTTPVRDNGGSTTARIRDGLAVLRPLTAGERAPLAAVFAGMSPDSRYSRYLTGLSALPASMSRTLTEVDACHHVAWLASVAGQPAGIGRYIRTAPHTAELAFEVVDSQQDRGIGTVLVDVLTTIAAVSGLQRLEATVLPSNTPSLRLLGQVGLSFRADDGLLEGAGQLRLLPSPRVDRPAVARIALAAAIDSNEPCALDAAGAQ